MRSKLPKTDRQVTVSDHALVRWLERVNKIDVSVYREQIASVCRDAMAIGATSIQIDGFLYLFDPNTSTIITVLTPDQRKHRNYGDQPKTWMFGKEKANGYADTL